MNAAWQPPEGGGNSTQGEPLRARWRPRANRSGSTTHKVDVKPGKKPPRTKFGRIVATYGWRVYALPAMLALTALVGVNTVTASGNPADNAAGESGGGSGSVSGVSGRDRGGAPLATERRLDPVSPKIPTAELPAGGEFTESGEGTWQVVSGTSEVVGSGEPVLTYTVEVENGIDPSSYVGDKAFAKAVEATLSDPRGWIGTGQVSFERVDGENVEPDFRVSLTTPETTREPTVCGNTIEYASSCYNLNRDRVVINLARWVRGAMAFQGDLGLYRQYVINHEVGHALGNAHVGCPEDGALAPVMMQQTFGVANDYVAKLGGGEGPVPSNGKVCRPNAWPNPTARPAE